MDKVISIFVGIGFLAVIFLVFLNAFDDGQPSELGRKIESLRERSKLFNALMWALTLIIAIPIIGGVIVFAGYWLVVNIF